jgi:hypothetical protein
MCGQLTNSEGVRYTDFIDGLTPIYWRVYLDIGLRYAAWVVTIVITCMAQANGVSPLILVPLAAVPIAVLAPVAHFHEASHWNIAFDRDARGPTRSDISEELLFVRRGR